MPEIEVLSSLMIRDQVTSWFKSPHKEALKEECNLKEANFKRIMYLLRDKGLIVKRDGAGDFILCTPLINQKKQIEEVIKKDDVINFTFPFKLMKDE